MYVQPKAKKVQLRRVIFFSIQKAMDQLLIKHQ